MEKEEDGLPMQTAKKPRSEVPTATADTESARARQLLMVSAFGNVLRSKVSWSHLHVRALRVRQIYLHRGGTGTRRSCYCLNQLNRG